VTVQLIFFLPYYTTHNFRRDVVSSTQYSVGFLSCSRQNFGDAEITKLYQSFLGQEHIRSLQVPKKYINYNNTNIHTSNPHWGPSVLQTINNCTLQNWYNITTSKWKQYSLFVNCESPTFDSRKRRLTCQFTAPTQVSQSHAVTLCLSSIKRFTVLTINSTSRLYKCIKFPSQ